MSPHSVSPIIPGIMRSLTTTSIWTRVSSRITRASDASAAIST